MLLRCLKGVAVQMDAERIGRSVLMAEADVPVWAREQLPEARQPAVSCLLHACDAACNAASACTL